MLPIDRSAQGLRTSLNTGLKVLARGEVLDLTGGHPQPTASCTAGALSPDVLEVHARWFRRVIDTEKSCAWQQASWVRRIGVIFGEPSTGASRP
jgi:hypothetical protein